MLRPGGILYLTVNCRIPIVLCIGCPPSDSTSSFSNFTPEKPSRVLQQFGFELLDMVGWRQKAHEEDLDSQPRARLKARLGYCEFVASAIAQRRHSSS